MIDFTNIGTILATFLGSWLGSFIALATDIWSLFTGGTGV